MAAHSLAPHRGRLLRRRRFAAALGMAVLAVGLTAFSGPPIVLVNTSPSEPPGLYARTDEPPTNGRIIAFRIPAAGLQYVAVAMPYLRRRPLLKAVAAGPGDEVCEGGGRLTIDGRPRGHVVDRDHHGRALPRWEGCRRLGADEVFVFSDRVPNSFDSRYYGPVYRAAILGVYRLIVPLAGGHA